MQTAVIPYFIFARSLLFKGRKNFDMVTANAIVFKFKLDFMAISENKPYASRLWVAQWPFDRTTITRYCGFVPLGLKTSFVVQNCLSIIRRFLTEIRN